MLKFLSRMSHRDIHIINKSLPKQFSKSKMKIKEIGEEIEPPNQYEKGIIVFDDILGSSSIKYKDQFSIRGRQNYLDNYYLSQSYFDLPKRTILNNSNKIFLFNQTMKDIESIYRVVSGYDMSHDDFKQLCRKQWGEDYSYLCFDKSEKRYQERFSICNQSKNTYTE